MLPSPHITHLGNLYSLAASSNAEIRTRFYAVALTDPKSLAAKSFAPEAAKWVVGDDGTGVVKGRMKFCRPVFKAVHKVDPELSVAVFSKSKSAFHPIARKLIEKVRATIYYFAARLSLTVWTGFGNQCCIEMSRGARCMQFVLHCTEGYFSSMNCQ